MDRQQDTSEVTKPPAKRAKRAAGVGAPKVVKRPIRKGESPPRSAAGDTNIIGSMCAKRSGLSHRPKVWPAAMMRVCHG